MTVWLFDLGNTRLKYAPLLDTEIGPVSRAAHDARGIATDWLDALPAQIDTAVIASVAAPAVVAPLVDALTRRGARVLTAKTRPALGGLRIAYADPARLGVDRFLALLAAQVEIPGPSVVVGVGTALTVDLLDAAGQHLGGRIAPSPTLMREALAQRVVQLALDGGDYAEFAVDTADALTSGCDGAALGLIERSVAQAATHLGAVPALVVHGGGAEALQPRLPGARMRPDLVLAGLAHWYRAIASESA